MAVCSPNASHFLGDQEVAQHRAFGIPEGVRTTTMAPPSSPHSDLPHSQRNLRLTTVWGSQLHKAGFRECKGWRR